MMPEEKSSETKHSITLDGQKVEYTATAAQLAAEGRGRQAQGVGVLRRVHPRRVKDPADRPVTFSFNGGPGAASVWLHMGAFGPRSSSGRTTARAPAAGQAGRERVVAARRDRPGVHRSGRHRVQPGGARVGRQAVPRRPGGHRVGRRVHPPLDHPQPALGVAQVPGRRELRHHPGRRASPAPAVERSAWGSTASCSSRRC